PEQARIEARPEKPLGLARPPHEDATRLGLERTDETLVPAGVVEGPAAVVEESAHLEGEALGGERGRQDQQEQCRLGGEPLEGLHESPHRCGLSGPEVDTVSVGWLAIPVDTGLER